MYNHFCSWDPIGPIGDIMNKKLTTQQIVGTGLLLALEIIFQVIGNYLQFGPVSINLSLVAIVLAAVLYGPLSGAILGFFCGIIILFSPSTIAIFMPVSPFGTVVACLLKTTLAGLLAGFVYKALKNKNQLLGIILASILVPVINTGIFSAICLIFFRPILAGGANDESFASMMTFLIVGFIGWNFLLELGTTVVVSTILGLVLVRRKAA